MSEPEKNDAILFIRIPSVLKTKLVLHARRLQGERGTTVTLSDAVRELVMAALKARAK